MTGRRITYIALLVVAVVLHLAYGQYATHYMVIFLLCIPVLSLLLSLPAAISARTKLYGGDVVRRGRKSRVRLTGGRSALTTRTTAPWSSPPTPRI